MMLGEDLSKLFDEYSLDDIKFIWKEIVEKLDKVDFNMSDITNTFYDKTIMIVGKGYGLYRLQYDLAFYIAMKLTN